MTIKFFNPVKTKFLFTLSFFLVLKGLSAQQFERGVSGGLNAARIDGDGHELYGKLGLNAGAFAARAIVPEMLYWQLELKYTSRGKYNIRHNTSGNIIGMSLIDLRYIEMPLSMHYFLNEKVQLELGLSPDLLLMERYEDQDGPLPPNRDLDRFGITAFAGATYFISDPFAVGIRFNYSVIPFYKFEAFAIRYRDSGWFHDVLSINTRYYFTR